MHNTFVSNTNADGKDNGALHNPDDSSSAASSCFALIDGFASQIGKSELQANERMQIWNTLLQTLKESPEF
jgi:hypothetical protein